jgi:hypothetical protein
VVTAGQSTVLSWSTKDATTLSISPSIGTVTGTQVSVTPAQTTTYTLTASGTSGQVTATATVTVGSAPSGHYGSMTGADLGVGANLNGALPFPSDNAWNTNISQAQVDPNSANLIASIGLSTGLHPDFGSGTYNGGVIGIPYVVVSSAQAPVAITITGYPLRDVAVRPVELQRRRLLLECQYCRLVSPGLGQRATDSRTRLDQCRCGGAADLSGARAL